MKRFLGLVAAALAGAMAVGVAGHASGVSMLPALSFTACTYRSDVTLSTASETLFVANPLRKSVTVSNHDASIAIFVKRGATATSAALRVPPGGSIEFVPEDGHMWFGAIDAIAASGTPTISAEECYR